MNTHTFGGGACEHTHSVEGQVNSVNRAGVDSPTLAGPYFRGALIRWAWHHRKKSSCHNWELNPFLLLVKQVH